MPKAYKCFILNMLIEHVNFSRSNRNNLAQNEEIKISNDFYKSFALKY